MVTLTGTSSCHCQEVFHVFFLLAGMPVIIINNNNNLLKAYSPVKHRVTSGLFERLVQIENQNVIDPLMYCVTVLGHLYVNKSHTIFGHVLCSHLLSTTTKSSVLWMTQISQIS